MRNRLVFVVVAVVLLFGGLRTFFGLTRQSSARASNAVKLSALALRGQQTGCFDTWAKAGAPRLDCPAQPADCERLVALLRCAHPTDTLPDGLAWGTAGSLEPDLYDGWLKAGVQLLQTPREDLPDVCVGLLLLSQELSQQGGAPGVRYGSRLALLAVPVCAHAQATPEVRAAAAARLAGSPPFPLSQLVKSIALDAQLRRFGTWMREEDLAALPPGMRALAARAPPPPDSFPERRSRLAQWQLAQRTADALGAALDAAPEDAAARDAALKAFEARWPERVAPPAAFRTAVEEDVLRREATRLLLAAWQTGPDCKPPDPKVSGAPEPGGCVVSLGSMQVHLPLDGK